MEEKTIIKSERYDVKKILFGFLILACIAAIIILLVMQKHIAWQIESHNDGDCYRISFGHWGKCNSSLFFCVLSRTAEGILWILLLSICGGITLIGLFIFFLLKSMEIVVTDKRVHGRTYFGKRVDLPLDSVSSVGSAWLKGITVATSSGKISFLLIKNAREIHEEIKKLLIERQEKEKTAQPEKVSAAASVADELKNYKELLDSGIITQEEFDKKKKELLGF